MHPLVNIATQAARAAGKLIVRNLDSLEKVAVHTKGDRNFVTSVDKASEQEIIHIIRKAYPDHAILAEESGQQGTHHITWIIDPLDGTVNFIHGIPHFAISIGIQIQGRLEHGVIYDPIRNELFFATRGQGAVLNDRKIRVSKQSSVENSMLGTGFTYANPELLAKTLPLLNATVSKVAGLRRLGSAALDLAYVAAGRLDGFWEFGLKPWDLAAGAVIIREAGGLITTLAGEDAILEANSVLAANMKLQKALLQHFHQVSSS